MSDLEHRVKILEIQQHHQVEGLAEFVRYWRTNPARAEQGLKAWLKAISPNLNLDPR